MKYNGLVLNKFTEIPFMSLEANFKIHNFNITYSQTNKGNNIQKVIILRDYYIKTIQNKVNSQLLRLLK